MERIWPTGERELKETIPLRSYIQGEVACPDTPFKATRWWHLVVRRIVLTALDIVERMSGTVLLIENEHKELIALKYGTRQLLVDMIRTGTITSWESGVSNNHGGAQFVCTLNVGDIYNDEGDLLCKGGSLTGHGSAQTVDAAAVIAEAEVIERIAATQWSPKEITYTTVRELQKQGVPHYAHSFVADLTSSELEEPLGWLPIRNLFTGQKTLAPASTLYLFYEWLFSQEPTFIDLSSSGVAAQTTVDKALLGAMYEGFERDGLLMYWLNNLSPQRIELSSIPFDNVLTTVKELMADGFSVYLLDCKTEYGVPIIVMVTIDNRTGGVSVHAAAGSDPARVLQKVCADTLRWETSFRAERPKVALEDIVLMEDREAYWYGGYMREYIDQFVRGQDISYEEYVRQFELPQKKGTKGELQWVSDRVRKAGSDAYFYEYKNQLAADAGLAVVRVIIPDLIPIYFNEARKHTNVPRLYTFAQRMGMSRKETSAHQLNKTPHPFI